MLEQMRRSSQSLLIYVLFGIVIAVFVINFGPQSSSGCEGQAGKSESVAASVDGRAVTPQDFRYGYILQGGGQAPPQMARQSRLKERVMDGLIERELLAKEAERLGFRVSDEEVEDMLAEAKILALGSEVPLGVAQKDGKFDYESFRRFVQYSMGMSPRSFIEQQRREMLAARVRGILRGGANISEDEVRAAFIRHGNQVNLEYVRFPARRYEAQIEPTHEEVTAYGIANEAKLKKLYEQRKFLYEKAPRERKLRHILVKVDAAAPAATDAAAKKKAEVLLARIKRGESFANVAKAASEDARTKGRGGDLGWRRLGSTQIGGEVEEKVFPAKDGDVVGPIKGNEGWYLVVAEGTREGDITFEQARIELADDQLRQDKAKDKARADAAAALAKAKAAPSKNLSDLFPAPAEKPSDSAAEMPQAEETGLFMRRGAVVEGIGTSPEVAKAAFALTTEAPFGGPAEVSGSYVIFKLKERKQADMADFEKRKIALLREAALAKGEEVATQWAQRRCQEVKDAKRIDVNRDLLRYESGPEGAVAYEPCAAPTRF